MKASLELYEAARSPPNGPWAGQQSRGRSRGAIEAWGLRLGPNFFRTVVRMISSHLSLPALSGGSDYVPLGQGVHLHVTDCSAPPPGLHGSVIKQGRRGGRSVPGTCGVGAIIPPCAPSSRILPQWQCPDGWLQELTQKSERFDDDYTMLDKVGISVVATVPGLGHGAGTAD
jgi:hypothetical protein